MALECRVDRVGGLVLSQLDQTIMRILKRKPVQSAPCERFAAPPPEFVRSNRSGTDCTRGEREGRPSSDTRHRPQPTPQEGARKARGIERAGTSSETENELANLGRQSTKSERRTLPEVMP